MKPFDSFHLISISTVLNKYVKTAIISVMAYAKSRKNCKGYVVDARPIIYTTTTTTKQQNLCLVNECRDTDN